MQPLSQQPQKNLHIPPVSEAHRTGTDLGDASACEKAKHAARENNLAAGTTSVKERLSSQQTSEETKKYRLVVKHILSKKSTSKMWCK